MTPLPRDAAQLGGEDARAADVGAAGARVTAADVINGDARWATLVGDVRETLRGVPDGCAQTCVTSPPYFGLRDYGNAAQIGQETTPREFVDALVAVMRDVRRVLADDGTLWLNIGDSYAAQGGNGAQGSTSQRAGRSNVAAQMKDSSTKAPDGYKPKDLLGIPWRLAFALQDDGWYLRSDIIWAKPNPMPESVTDRPTRAHEYVFLLTKRARYFYDADAIREDAATGTARLSSVTPDAVRSDARKSDRSGANGRNVQSVNAESERRDSVGCAFNNNPRLRVTDGKRNARDVWTITPEPCAEAHFATMPPDLARRCILAGSRRGDIVLDPFGGAGTTALAALQHGRRALLCELNPEYVEIQRRRLADFAADTTSPIDARGADFGPLFGGAR